MFFNVFVLDADFFLFLFVDELFKIGKALFEVGPNGDIFDDRA